MPLPNSRITYLPLLNCGANRPAINQGDVFMNCKPLHDKRFRAAANGVGRGRNHGK